MGNYGGKPIEEQIFDLKFASKSFERDATRCEKEVTKAKNKVKKALAKGETQFAHVHAEYAITEHNNSLYFLKMAAKLDTLASRLKSAAIQTQFMEAFSKISPTIQEALRTQDMQSLDTALAQLDTQTQLFNLPDVALNVKEIRDVQDLLDELSSEVETLKLPDVPISVFENAHEPDNTELRTRLDNLPYDFFSE